MKTVIILRGVSGSGKSSFANFLEGLYNWGQDGKSLDSTQNCIVCCADDFFEKDGKYNFKPELLGVAHNHRQAKFLQALSENKELIIVANTNTQESEFQYYIEQAKSFDYQIFSLIIENRHGNTNQHNVPDKTLKKQRDRILKSIKLL